MWAAFLMRIIRKRIVLGIIFAMALTYCILSFLHEVDDLSGDEIDNVALNRPNQDFLWHSAKEDSNGTDIKVTICRNSVQGKVLIVDDRGYICSRADVLPNGCCNTESESTKRYSCETCKDNGCCSIYEYCISCCLHPDKAMIMTASTEFFLKHRRYIEKKKRSPPIISVTRESFVCQKNLLQNMLGKASEKFNVLFASVTDQFELCLAKCRTSSQSVQHENSYRDPKAKHCYGETPPIEADMEKR